MLQSRSLFVLGTSSLIFGAHVASAQIDLDVNAAGRAASELGSAAGSVAGDIHAPVRGIDDAQIGVFVQSELTSQLHMPSVRSDVRNGVVTLNGVVATEAEKQRAEQIARRVEGVTRVRNALVVEHAASSTASGAAASGAASVGDHLEQRATAVGPSTDTAISTRLQGDTRLAQRDIDVHTRNDVVTLTGEVQSVAEKEAAGRIAAETAAGAEVRNRLTVRAKD